jgi:hypothetical protein
MRDDQELGGVAGGILRCFDWIGGLLLCGLIGRNPSRRATLQVRAGAGGFFSGAFLGIAATFCWIPDMRSVAKCVFGTFWGGIVGLVLSVGLVLLLQGSSQKAEPPVK